MSRFDEFVEKREEERNRERYARLNALLEKSLKTRSREEVILELFGLLRSNSCMASGLSMPLGEGGYAKEGNGAKALVF